MNNAQEMSPDFVLMRLVSAAEDRLDTEHGPVALGGLGGLGKDVLAHSGGKAAHANKGRPSRGAPDAGLMEDPAPRSPPSHTPREAQGYEFAPSAGLRPQLLVFSNIIHNGDLILDLDRLNESRNVLDQNPGCSGPAVTDNPLSPQGVRQHQDPLDQGWSAHPSAAAETRGAAEPCHRHRILTDTPEWPGLSDTSDPLAMITGGREGAVFQLARRFGELGVGSVPKMLFKAGELPQCSCKNAHGPMAAESGDDPTETSDALLVLEGLGSGDVDCLDMDQCPEDEADNEHARQEFLLARKREIAQKMSGAFSISSFQLELRRRVETDPDQVSPSGSQTKSPTPVQCSPWATSPNQSHASTPRRRPERCASAPRTPTGQDRTLNVHGKSKKVSLRSRLSKLFRTHSCSGSSRVLDKRPSVASSAGSLVDVGPSGAEQDVDRWEASLFIEGSRELCRPRSKVRSLVLTKGISFLCLLQQKVLISSDGSKM